MIHRRPQSVRLAFTIVELLVVIAVIALIVAISVPSFGSMLKSAERSMAENSLRASLLTARDLAIQSDRGGDAAAVFLFEPNGKLSIVPAVQVGSIDDWEGASSGSPAISGTPAASRVRRDVFIPSGDSSVTMLPRFWGVRGYAMPGLMRETTIADTIVTAWYDSPLYGGDTQSAIAKDEGNWVFPETGLYDIEEQQRLPERSSTPRQSFMVRFEAGTGRLSLERTAGVFLDPRASDNRSQDISSSEKPGDPNFWKRVDKAVDLDRWASRVLYEPDPDGDGSPYGGPSAFVGDRDLMERSMLIGSRSHDTVLVRSVGRLALYDIRRLARGIGARGLNTETQSLYKPFDPLEDEIEIDNVLFGSTPPTLDDIRISINHWVVGDTDRPNATTWPVGDGVLNFDPDDAVDDDTPEAMLFVISPYTGQVREIER